MYGKKRGLPAFALYPRGRGIKGEGGLFPPFRLCEEFKAIPRGLRSNPRGFATKVGNNLAEGGRE